MARSLNVKVSGVWEKARVGYVKVSGAWVPWKAAWVKVGGVWQKFYPEVEDGTVALDRQTAGSGNIVVPMGIRRADIQVVGGGGGGSSLSFCGDGWSGGGGGAGGWAIGSKTVIPGETLSWACGLGGAGGIYPGNCLGHTSGQDGGNSFVTGSFGTIQGNFGQGGQANPGGYPLPGVAGAGGGHSGGSSGGNGTSGSGGITPCTITAPGGTNTYTGTFGHGAVSGNCGGAANGGTAIPGRVLIVWFER